MTNLFDNLPECLAEEVVERLVDVPGVRIERITSHGQASADGFWYDQTEHEWVVLLRGAARVRFEDDQAPVEMRPGDCLDIPPHRRHRVEWTTPDEISVWLAVFVRD